MPGPERRFVEPYRDWRDAVLARRDALISELRELTDELRTVDASTLSFLEISEARRSQPAPRCARCEDLERSPSEAQERRRWGWGRVGAHALHVLAACALSASLAAAVALALSPLGMGATGLRERAQYAELDRSATAREPAPPIHDALDPSLSVIREPAPVIGTDADRSIRWIAPQAWEVDRDLFDAPASPGTTASVRILPHERGGRVVGIRVYGVRRQSLLGRLGLRNGDTILDVNGIAIADPDAALRAYARARSSDALFVRLERRGEERIHVYRIVGERPAR